MIASYPCSLRRIYVLISIAMITALCLLYWLFAKRALVFVRVQQLVPQSDNRVANWDWKDTKDEIFCRARNDVRPYSTNVDTSAAHSKAPIPNIAHFVLLSQKGELYELTYARYLAIKAAILRLNATEVKIHIYDNGLNIENTWWRQIADHVTLVSMDRPEIGPYGVPIQNVRIEHQSDFVRLAVLEREGGIYLDTDVYVLKPFTDLLSSPRDALMGHEGANRYGLCNAVIISRPSSAFIVKWQASYRTFNSKGWNEHSVHKPKQLQAQHPDLICALSPVVFFWPTWAKQHTLYMYAPINQDEKLSLQANISAFDGAMYENQLAFHAWSYGSHDYLPFLTPDTIMKDTRFNVLVREIAMADL